MLWMARSTEHVGVLSTLPTFCGVDSESEAAGGKCLLGGVLIILPTAKLPSVGMPAGVVGVVVKQSNTSTLALRGSPNWPTFALSG